MCNIRKLCFLLIIALSCTNGQLVGGPSAVEVASRAVVAVQDAMAVSSWTNFRNFGSWSYEGGTITRGLWELQGTLPELELEDFLHQHLDYFLDTEDEFGYRILHNESLNYNNTSIFVPWLYSIGDVIGLFPIVYSDRLRYAARSGSHPRADDIYILSEVVEKYIYGYPWHLSDGTISRPLAWNDEGFIEPHGTAVWVDDMFMGTALLTEWAWQSGEVEHLVEAGNQILAMADYLGTSIPVDGLLHHGYNAWDNHLSCCKWGRGNGWAFIGTSEVLGVAKDMGVDATHPRWFRALHRLFQDHAQGILDLQDKDGRWHNLLNDNSTFLETSSTAMFLTGLGRGLRRGWLEQEDKDVVEAIEAAWVKVAQNVLEDGTMTGIIGGTGIKDTAEEYTPKDTSYSHASPGVGAVLRAIAEVAKLQKQMF